MCYILIYYSINNTDVKLNEYYQIYGHKLVKNIYIDWKCCMNKLIGILKTLIAGYIITIALLIIISICMYKMSLSNNIISICITAAYGISTFAGGLILGHIRKCNRLIWGILYGIIYFCILCVISVAINQGSGFDIASAAKCIGICCACGGAGGFFSP